MHEKELVNIFYCSRVVEKLCNKKSYREQKLGQKRARKLGARHDDLAAAKTLEDMRNLPGRCHELKGNLQGILSLDLDGQYRMLFKVADDPCPTKKDGGIDWSNVTSVLIVKIGVDTHE